jgi:hypothetical protein
MQPSPRSSPTASIFPLSVPLLIYHAHRSHPGCDPIPNQPRNFSISSLTFVNRLPPWLCYKVSTNSMLADAQWREPVTEQRRQAARRWVNGHG